MILKAFLPLLATLPLGASPRVDFARGVLEEQRGNHATAATAFDAARSADPDAFPLMLRVATRHQAAGDLASASTLHREFAKRHPERLDAQLAYVDFLRAASPNDDFVSRLAGEVLDRALTSFPDNLPLVQRRFRVHEALGERERSLALFEQVAARPGDALAALEMARTLFPKDDSAARGRLDTLLQDACRRAPGDRTLARAASEHFRTTGRLSESIDLLAAHADADPSSLDLRVRLGLLQLAAQRQVEGEASLLAVVDIDPRHALAHRALAKLYRKQERAAEARHHAAEALKIRGGDPADFLALADEFLTADQPREARLLLEKAVFRHPADAALAARLAVATRRDPQRRATAARLFREAESLSGSDGPAADPLFLQEFAEALLESGQTAAAEDRLRLAIRRFPAEQRRETAAALRRLAAIWQDDRRHEEAARALLQRADSLDPP